MTPDRERAWRLLQLHTKSESLLSHALAVEAVLGHIAAEWGEDADYWGEVGLLHDIDYEEHPEEHLQHAGKILEEAGYDQPFIHAILSHGWELCSDVKPESRMEQALYAVDELCGLVTACAYMRPSKSVTDLEFSSVKKKFKDKRFAAGVDRQVILKGCQLLELSLEELTGLVIAGMRNNHEAIGV